MTADATTESSSARKVLLVDDSDDLRELYQLALESHGYEIQVASLAEDALALMRTWRPHLVITDLFMPGIGGLERRVRSRRILLKVGRLASNQEIAGSSPVTRSKCTTSTRATSSGTRSFSGLDRSNFPRTHDESTII